MNRSIAAAIALVALTTSALSQQASLPIPFNLSERNFLLQMCEAAQWANRIQFGGTCDQLKAKFAEAEKKAAAPVAPPPAVAPAK